MAAFQNHSFAQQACLSIVKYKGSLINRQTFFDIKIRIRKGESLLYK